MASLRKWTCWLTGKRRAALLPLAFPQKACGLLTGGHEAHLNLLLKGAGIRRAQGCLETGEGQRKEEDWGGLHTLLG